MITLSAFYREKEILEEPAEIRLQGKFDLQLYKHRTCPQSEIFIFI